MGNESSIARRIRSGEVDRKDVVRRLAELAFGRVNDCVKLALEEAVEPEMVINRSGI